MQHVTLQMHPMNTAAEYYEIGKYETIVKWQ